MKRWTLILLTALMCAMVALGCSGGAENNSNPVLPGSNADLTNGSNHAGQIQTHLWGYWDILIDVENQTVEAVLNRDAMFTANVTSFLNGNPASMSFSINDIITDPDYIDVDIDVALTHPFFGMPQYAGYDVRGIFMGDGSATLTSSGVTYPVFGTDQFMFADTVDGYGGPDGYTRWYNYSEFSTGGMSLLSYTQGNLATPGFSGTATLCPYKYYADSLGTNDDLWDWLTTHVDQNGVFSSGATNERNYYLRFPNDKGVTYGYAVIANWEGEDIAENHPSNAVEAVTCSVVDNSTLFYVDAANNGGDLILDVSLFGWEYQPSTIIIESTVLTIPASYDPAAIATGGGDHYSTYSVEISADNISGTEGNEFWVIAEYDSFNYSNEFGVSNDAAEETLGAYFRYGLIVSNTEECPDPAVTGIDPDYLLTGWNFDALTITGTGLVNGPSLAALLRKDGESDIIGTNVLYVDNSTMTAEFDLTGAVEGLWDIVITNGCGKEGTGVELLEVYLCGSISGFTSDYDAVIVYGDDAIYGGYAGMAGTQTGTPYAIGVSRNYYSGSDHVNRLGAKRVSTGNGSPDFLSDITGTIGRDVVCDSQNNVYFTDMSDYNRLRYFPFDETTGFGTVVDFDNIDSGWSIWRITIDENDNPVVLGYSGASLRVYHWNSVASDWDTTDIPAAVGSNNITGDFDWNPLMEHYVFITRINTTQSNLYAVDTDGNLAATIEDIFNGTYFTALPGIYIDINDPTCRIVTWGGWTSSGTYDTPFTRMNAAYVERTTTSINAGNYPGSSLIITGSRGQVALGSNRLIVGARYINVFAKVPLPADW